jgi:NADH-quinone oxidoreductase subunit L
MHHEQNIWRMGGLQSKMRVTFVTFAIATAALTGFPFLSGFFSKDAILAAAYDHHRAIFWLALGTAFLTAFYMFRLVVVVFFGKARTEQASHGHESPGVMLGPLVILAIPSVLAGWPRIAGAFLNVPHEESAGTVTILATCAFVLGAALAWVLYSGKSHDPVRIPLFANKFYFDELYAELIRWTQDLLANISGWFDRWILDGVLVRGVSGGTWVTGFVLRFLQMGNLQGYAFIFGIGAIVLIYFVLAR